MENRKSLRDIQLDNTVAFLKEYRTGKVRKTVVVEGHDSKESVPIAAGQIRASGEGRILVIRERTEGWLVCQLGDYDHPAAESELKVSDGEILLMWNAFPSNTSALLETTFVGTLPEDDLKDAIQFYDVYMQIRKIPDRLKKNTGIGSVWDTEELIRYMDHMSAKIGDFIVKAIA